MMSPNLPPAGVPSGLWPAWAFFCRVRSAWVLCITIDCSNQVNTDGGNQQCTPTETEIYNMIDSQEQQHQQHQEHLSASPYDESLNQQFHLEEYIQRLHRHSGILPPPPHGVINPTFPSIVNNISRSEREAVQPSASSSHNLQHMQP